MPFIQNILKYDSLSIVGLEKNTGKTECLNYILRRLPSINYRLAVTSIGLDGEEKDQVTQTVKPEIFLKNGMLFATAESYYRKKHIEAELLDISQEESSMGRIITARALRVGKVLLAGPSSTASLQRWMKEVDKYDVNIKIIDGALNRLSLASPAVSSAMILSTGAAYSANMRTLVNKTKYIVDLISIESVDKSVTNKFANIGNGIWGETMEGEIINITNKSSLLFKSINMDFTKKCKKIYVNGALTDGFLNILINASDLEGTELIVEDFTKIFTSENIFRFFLKKGGKIKVLRNSNLIAVCVNPIAPNGYVLDSDILCDELNRAIKLPVYDIVKNNYC